MAILVFVETSEGKVKTTSIEAVAYAHAMGGPVTAIALGAVEKEALEALGKYGADKVLHATDERLNQGIIQAYAAVLEQAMEAEGTDILVLANSSLGTPIAARVATKLECKPGIERGGTSRHECWLCGEAKHIYRQGFCAC